MSSSTEAVDALVARVAARDEGGDSRGVRDVLERVIAELEVAPGDPAWTDGRDIIGAAYERLLPGHARRPLGQFFTPLWIGRVMARWLLDGSPGLLLDPGCGSGSLLAAVAHERSKLTRLLGLDVDPLAIKMTEANRALRKIRKLELRCRDFLLDDLAERPDAIICNPPYTRHQALSASTKRLVHDGFTKRLGIRFSHLASLHVLFLVRALEIAADEARLAFITPTHWLDMNYADEVKELLLAQAHVEAIISFPTKELVFDHAVTTATVTLIRKGAQRSSTRLLQVSATSRDEIAAALRDQDAGELVTLSASGKWSRRARRTSRQGVRLGDVADIKRGVATGCNAFFVLSDRDRRDFRLASSCLRSCIASPRLFTTDDIDEAVLAALPETAPRWLLSPSRQPRKGPLAHYLRRGEDEFAVRDRYLVRQREEGGHPWFTVDSGFPSAILFSYFNRGRPRFVRNRVGGIPLNNWLTIHPHPGVDVDDLLDILRGETIRRRLKNDCRQYGNGLWKLEPSELKRIWLPIATQSLQR
jgi:adenine-specific DNA-methyltransferase